MLGMIGLFAFLSISLMAVVLGRQLSSPRTRLRERVEAISRGGHVPTMDYRGRRLLRMQNYSSLPVLRGVLQRSPWAERVADDLERAAVPLRVGEYLVLRVGVGLLFALAVQMVVPASPLQWLLMLLAFFIGTRAPLLMVKARIRRRQGQIETHLPDALDMISRSLRTGGGLLSSIDGMAEQMGGAIAAEFGRTTREIAAGLAVEEAFRDLDRRVPSKDLHIVITAILIQREVGGNLAEILDNVAATMRDRVRLRGEMRTMVSRQRLSAWVIASVPVIVLAALAAMSSEAVRPLFEREGGRIVLGIAFALEVVGFITMYRMASSFEV